MRAASLRRTDRSYGAETTQARKRSQPGDRFKNVDRGSMTVVPDKAPIGEEHARRVRRICMSMPGCEEKLSHGEPTWFVRKRVFAMFANNHHNDGHVAIWIPAAPGLKQNLISTAPDTFFRPPYVGVKGWVGIELSQIGEEELTDHIISAWKMVAPKSLANGGSVV